MSALSEKKCKPCEGGVAPLTRDEASTMLVSLRPEWSLTPDGKALRRADAFRNFYHTMAFVNAMAYIANTEDHHPDIECGYNYCRLEYTTHAIGGLSENDFICAAKIDALIGK